MTTNDGSVAKEVAAGRNHGWRSLVPPDLPAPGLNYRLSDILCAVGLPQIGVSTSCSPPVRGSQTDTPSGCATCPSRCRLPPPATCTAGRPT